MKGTVSAFKCHIMSSRSKPFLVSLKSVEIFVVLGKILTLYLPHHFLLMHGMAILHAN
jgi:hypothetical protein